MKVICAGFSKTGTKSLKAALTELGYNVYDFFENYRYLGDDWNKICIEGGTTEDFRRMFENVDAVTDQPGAYFWDEIHRAFPEAKIILTIREDEDVWAESWHNQIVVSDGYFTVLMGLLSPTHRKLQIFGNRLCSIIMGSEIKRSFFRPAQFNMLLARMHYRRHNANVIQNAPKDKLLVYKVKEGWGPLCKFLGVEAPSTPFPHKNVKGDILEEFRKKEPVIIRVQREVLISLSLLVILCSYGVFKLSKSSPSTWFETVCNFATPMLDKIAFWN